MGKMLFQQTKPVIPGEPRSGEGVLAAAYERDRRQTLIGISHPGSLPLAMLTHRSAGNDTFKFEITTGGTQ